MTASALTASSPPDHRGDAARLARQNNLLDVSLRHFEPVALAQVEALALMDRCDRKYVLSADQLLAALAMTSGAYRVLEIAGERRHGYETVYFDTEDFEFYRAHHANRPRRFKVRSRRYAGTADSFLELKRRTPAGRTIKTRFRTTDIASSVGETERALLSSVVTLPDRPLPPSLHSRFTRITLAGISGAERVTVDVDLRASAHGEAVALPGLVIAEVKQERCATNSAFVAALRAANLHPTEFSKYCVGVALLCPDMKHNRFKPQLLRMEKAMRGDPHDR